MTDTATDLLSTSPSTAEDRRRLARRHFLRTTGRMTAAAGGLALLSACGGSGDGSTDTSTPTPTPTSTDTSAIINADALNLALNFAYLQAQFFTFATTGAGVAAVPDSNTPAGQTDGKPKKGAYPGGGAALLTGTGQQGTVTGGRAVSFADPLIAQYAREIAADDLAHLAFLRSALGSSAVAMPSLNIDGGASGAFSTFARAAGYVASGVAFDPYASDLNFLLAAFIFKDVAVTAYKGVATLLTSTLTLDAAAGLLTTQAYHAALIRTTLYTLGQGTAAGQFSNARDAFDGSVDIDQGITGTATTANIVPADAQGRVYTRTAGQVLNVAYQNSAAVTSGGFFPAGANGNIKTSAASNA
ncbi:ferritin-like domain-containing protein [Sphingomonas sp. H39-1-10]|uniref:ferritin-like domain-containing protein n=1 Tax=Sphingomonas TaxID=13687 RepID=UPI000889AEEA|nr:MULTISPECIES: ferritin-like domain-containing protein [Sphingomonas]MDF0486819.1 ferritin-like domain-containing protein [Sphingomonas pollutisoli]SDA35061.1 Ferritin-like domain-containing protein [Sphingomonas sp. NFR15]